VIRDAPQLVLIALAICVLVGLCELAVTSDNTGHKALRILLDGLSTVLLVPFQIGAYRMILLGEQPSRYLAYYSERFLPYLKWAMLFWLPTAAVEFAPEAHLVSVLVLIGFAMVAVVVTVRLAVLFPALAAGRIDVTAKDAWHDTQGKIWTVIRVMLVVIVPLTAIVVVWIAGMVMLSMTEGTSSPSIWELMLRTVLTSAVMLVATTVLMATAALLFDLIGDRVKPAG
jgi:hypothetical protein